VSEVIHGAIRLSVSTVRSCNVNGDDRRSDQECDNVSAQNGGDLDSACHGVTTCTRVFPRKNLTRRSSATPLRAWLQNTRIGHKEKQRNGWRRWLERFVR